MTPIKLDSAAVRRIVESPKRTGSEREYPTQPYTTAQSDTWSLVCWPKPRTRIVHVETPTEHKEEVK